MMRGIARRVTSLSAKKDGVPKIDNAVYGWFRIARSTERTYQVIIDELGQLGDACPFY